MAQLSRRRFLALIAAQCSAACLGPFALRTRAEPQRIVPPALLREKGVGGTVLPSLPPWPPEMNPDMERKRPVALLLDRGVRTSAESPIICMHLTDTHSGKVLEAPGEPSLAIARFRAGLEQTKIVGADIVVIPGDITETNQPAEYEAIIDTFESVRGFSIYPNYGSGIPVMITAGNHDAYGPDDSIFDQYLGPFESTRAIGDWRFVAWSGQPYHTVPHEWIEAQYQLACDEGRHVVSSYHFPPKGWPSATWDMPDYLWALFNEPMQSYDVRAYVTGHTHFLRTGAISPGGYVAHDAGAMFSGYSSAFALYDGRYNVHSHVGLNQHAVVLIYSPAQYHDGADWSQSAPALTQVRALVACSEGTITRVYYTVDGGPQVNMQRVGSSEHFAADLDASGLSGIHEVQVVATHSYGSWATRSHAIQVRFAASVPPRVADGCNPTQAYEIDLVEGWNMISLPYEPLDGQTAPDTFFASLIANGNLTAVFTHANGQWSSFHPGSSSSTLTDVHAAKGYWAQAARACTLSSQGTGSGPYTIALGAGWNLVAGPTGAAVPVGNLVKAGSGVVAIWHYDQSGTWHAHALDAPDYANTLTHLEQGKSYWLRCEAATSVVI